MKNEAILINMEKEEWRIIEQAPNYEVSNFGNVRHIINKKNRTLGDNGKGYKTFGYRENGKLKRIYVHRAVAQAFVFNDDPKNKTQISHLDESRDNNRADNLTWATAKENCNMPLHFIRMSEGRGEAVRCVETGMVYCSQREAARQLNMTQSAISNCLRGKSKTAGGYHWERVLGQ